MNRLEDIFHELGDPTRLRVFGAILERRRNVSQIVAELGLTQPQVSYHLKRLKDVGLAVEEKDGRWVWYQANRETTDEALRSLLNLMSDWMPVPSGAPAPASRAWDASRGGPEAGEGAEERAAGDSGAAPGRESDEEGRPIVRRPVRKKDDLEDFLL